MRASLAVLAFWPAAALAGPPLSAIDWLNDPALAPVVQHAAPQTGATQAEPPVTDTATSPSVDVSTLDQPAPDSVGLLSSSMTGLPVTLWQSSQAGELADLLRAQKVDDLPAMQSLLYTLLLTEAEAPQGSGPSSRFLLARLDSLMALGAVEPVQALLDRAGATTPALFSRWFDATLLTGDEDQACAALMRAPHLAPSYAARVFCTARSGDWMTAALTLDTARVLGFVSTQEDALLSRFLDSDLFEAEPLPHPPVRPSPLIFRLREAIGEPMPTAPLPRAFAVADLRGTVGWKAKIEAAERLARTAALADNRLLGIYSERLPAASGGIWDRVEAVQRFDTAIKAGDPGAAARVLPQVWVAMQAARLEAPFARLFADALLRLPLTGAAAETAYRIALLSPGYEAAAKAKGASLPQMAFLTSLAQGQPLSPSASPTATERAIQDAFASTVAPATFARDLQDGKLGEVILRAMLLYQQAVRGETKELVPALSTFRALGLEDMARQAALQILLLMRGV
ncbi:hypothetical protein [Thalassovita taeanensis]|uniref:Antifreeze glycopeptide polyprotein n=1 Tax=Thalassovita taeanensis TaxID=657014 RepID=A0A1H8YX38_9RHOB|nr:hypothetical protein [Thalassovita taeanensis]SEP56795.1 hypothetical protein SAMN04488092_101188 [Thalassovita taeanensis]